MTHPMRPVPIVDDPEERVMWMCDECKRNIYTTPATWPAGSTDHTAICKGDGKTYELGWTE